VRRIIHLVATLALLGACAAAPGDEIVDSEATLIAGVTHEQTSDLNALSDAEFFAGLRYSPIDAGAITNGPAWAQSTYLATLDMIDAIRFSSGHRGELHLFLVDEQRYVAHYVETQWTAVDNSWHPTASRTIRGDYRFSGPGTIALDGFGTAKRNVVGKRAGLAVYPQRNFITSGIAGDVFIVQQALSSAPFQAQ
jgi:hypothetical protein